MTPLTHAIVEDATFGQRFGGFKKPFKDELWCVPVHATVLDCGGLLDKQR